MRYCTEHAPVITPASLIEELMGGEALDPIRVYAGLGSSASPVERARRAVQELVRLGGLERSRVVFYCPTGAGCDIEDIDLAHFISIPHC